MHTTILKINLQSNQYLKLGLFSLFANLAESLPTNWHTSMMTPEKITDKTTHNYQQVNFKLNAVNVVINSRGKIKISAVQLNFNQLKKIITLFFLTTESTNVQPTIPFLTLVFGKLLYWSSQDSLVASLPPCAEVELTFALSQFSVYFSGISLEKHQKLCQRLFKKFIFALTFYFINLCHQFLQYFILQ